jgi:hypothetical protein
MAARPDSLNPYVALLRSGAGACPQLAANVEDETLLGPCCWNDLESRAATSVTADDAVACLRSWGFGHQRHGPELKPPLPRAVARVVTDTKFTEMVAEALASAGLGTTPVDVRPLLEAWKWLDPAEPSLDRYRAIIPLGQYVIWATYNEADPSADPASAFAAAIAKGGLAVLDAAGLGPAEAAGANEAWIVCYSLPVGVPLHTPTIADAGAFPLFRPSNRRAGLPGTTAPPSGQAGIPEVVHEVVHANHLTRGIDRYVIP